MDDVSVNVAYNRYFSRNDDYLMCRERCMPCSNVIAFFLRLKAAKCTQVHLLLTFSI